MKHRVIAAAIILLLSSCTSQTSSSISSSSIPETTGSTTASQTTTSTTSTETIPQTQDTTSQTETTVSSSNSKPESEDAETARLRLMEEKKNVFGGLTLQQMQEDLDYLWNFMQDNYPFLGVAKRMGIDGEAIYQKYRGQLPQIDGDSAFSNLLREFVDSFQFVGHFQYYMYSSDFYSVFNSLKHSDELYPGSHLSFLVKQLENPTTMSSYKKLDELTQQIDALSSPGREETQAQAKPETVLPENLEMEILEDGKNAYVKIRSFGKQYIETDHDRLIAFYQQAADCVNLIIDLTGNGGGSDNYWWTNIVSPNLSAPITNTELFLFNDTPIIQEYLKIDGYYAKAKPISELPPLPALVQEDVQRLTHFVESSFTIHPAGSQLFKGKIWVLVDEGVYSASESFSMFCKNTGFATLVGVPTGGDGGGIDPMCFTLPNSGMAMRFSVLYTINADGSNSEETGTIPDIIVQEGVSPLDACLKAIDATA